MFSHCLPHLLYGLAYLLDFVILFHVSAKSFVISTRYKQPSQALRRTGRQMTQGLDIE